MLGLIARAVCMRRQQAQALRGNIRGDTVTYVSCCKPAIDDGSGPVSRLPDMSR